MDEREKKIADHLDTIDIALARYIDGDDSELPTEIFYETDAIRALIGAEIVGDD